MRDENRSEAVGRNPDEVCKEGLGLACTTTLRVLPCTRRSELAPRAGIDMKWMWGYTHLEQDDNEIEHVQCS